MIYILPSYAIMVPFFSSFLHGACPFVGYKVCKTYFVSFTNKENNTFNTTPFRVIDKKQIYPYYP